MHDIEHLGDGAYVCHDTYQLWLGANHHNNMSVALEPAAMVNLLEYINTHFPSVMNKWREKQ